MVRQIPAQSGDVSHCYSMARLENTCTVGCRECFIANLGSGVVAVPLAARCTKVDLAHYRAPQEQQVFASRSQHVVFLHNVILILR
jgi:hypothetical protein